MIEQQPLKALTEGSDIDFIHNGYPKCPHCGASYDIEKNEAWRLYGTDGDENEVECNACDLTFKVKTVVYFKFNTDEQQ